MNWKWMHNNIVYTFVIDYDVECAMARRRCRGGVLIHLFRMHDWHENEQCTTPYAFWHLNAKDSFFSCVFVRASVIKIFVNHVRRWNVKGVSVYDTHGTGMILCREGKGTKITACTRTKQTVKWTDITRSQCYSTCVHACTRSLPFECTNLIQRVRQAKR